jgi:hypothetical protein
MRRSKSRTRLLQQQSSRESPALVAPRTPTRSRAITPSGWDVRTAGLFLVTSAEARRRQRAAAAGAARSRPRHAVSGLPAPTTIAELAARAEQSSSDALGYLPRSPSRPAGEPVDAEQRQPQCSFLRKTRTQFLRHVLALSALENSHGPVGGADASTAQLRSPDESAASQTPMST